MSSARWAAPLHYGDTQMCNVLRKIQHQNHHGLSAAVMGLIFFSWCLEASGATENLDYAQKENQRRQQGVQEQITKREQRLRQRIAALYKINREGYFAHLLFDAPTTDEFRARISALRQVIKRDRQELAMFLQERQRLRGEHQHLFDENKQISARPLVQAEKVLTPIKLLVPLASTVKKSVEQSPPRVTWETAGPQPVKSAASGDVRYVGQLAGLGQVVILEHPGQYFSVYGALSEAKVQRDEKIEAGQVLGVTGRDPLSTQYVLYFELRHGAEPIDSTSFLLR